MKLRILFVALPLLLFLLLMFLFSRGLHLNPHELPSAVLNKPIPKFSIPTLLKPSVRFSNNAFKDQVSVLNVFATWCNACATEHPIWVDIMNRYDVPIYGLDYKDGRENAKKWLKNYGNPYDVVGFDAYGLVAINLGVYGTPETFIIDQKGIVRFKYIGPINHSVWEGQLFPLIQKLRAER